MRAVLVFCAFPCAGGGVPLSSPAAPSGPTATPGSAGSTSLFPASARARGFGGKTYLPATFGSPRQVDSDDSDDDSPRLNIGHLIVQVPPRAADSAAPSQSQSRAVGVASPALPSTTGASVGGGRDASGASVAQGGVPVSAPSRSPAVGVSGAGSGAASARGSAGSYAWRTRLSLKRKQ